MTMQHIGLMAGTIVMMGLAGCGSENKGQPEPATPMPASQQPQPAPPPAARELSGTVINGYVQGARVCLDLNRNGQCDDKEPQSQTDQKGQYRFSISSTLSEQELTQAWLLAEVSTGAVAADRADRPISQSEQYRLLAPVQFQGAVISPFTTMLQASLNRPATPPATPEQETRALRQLLGLGQDAPLLGDYFAIRQQQAVANKLHQQGLVLARSLAQLGGNLAATDQLLTRLAGLGRLPITDTPATEEQLQAWAKQLVSPPTPATPESPPVAKPTVEQSPFDRKWRKLAADGSALSASSSLASGWRCVEDQRALIGDQRHQGQGDVWLLATAPDAQADDIKEAAIDKLVADANKAKLCGRTRWQVPSLAQLQELNTAPFKLDGRYWATLDKALFPDHQSLSQPTQMTNGAYWSSDFQYDEQGGFQRKVYLYASQEAGHIDQVATYDSRQQQLRLRLISPTQASLGTLDQLLTTRIAALTAAQTALDAQLAAHAALPATTAGWQAKLPTADLLKRFEEALPTANKQLQAASASQDSALQSLRQLVLDASRGNALRWGFTQPDDATTAWATWQATQQANQLKLADIQATRPKLVQDIAAARTAIAVEQWLQAMDDQQLEIQARQTAFQREVKELQAQPGSQPHLQTATLSSLALQRLQQAGTDALAAGQSLLVAIQADTARKALAERLALRLAAGRTALNQSMLVYIPLRRQLEAISASASPWAKLARDGSPLPLQAGMAEGWTCVQDRVRQQVWLLADVELKSASQATIRGQSSLMYSQSGSVAGAAKPETTYHLMELAQQGQLCGRSGWRLPKLAELAALGKIEGNVLWQGMLPASHYWTQEQHNGYQVASRYPFRRPDQAGAQEGSDFILNRPLARASAWLVADDNPPTMPGALEWSDRLGQPTQRLSDARCGRDQRPDGKLWLLPEKPVDKLPGGDARPWNRSQFDNTVETVAAYLARYNQQSICGVQGGWRLVTLSELKSVSELSVADQKALGFVRDPKNRIYYHWACPDAACTQGVLHDPLTQASDRFDGFKRADVHLIHD
ncbi:hypothetical protein HNQ59_000059 [Chitinivorax tropicus]|uniref:DUF1566 domain-containing protein n=1 Tax=Chitinivorax tropicus TaxID=714531 RepID=A0A840MJ41_9PROT|nr:hypothetical protein [Chitinivorax tropicus]MBB5016797.1 hypothetical protein [Chitinivorax tropicus]